MEGVQGQLAALQAQYDGQAREAAALRQQLVAREVEQEAGADSLAALEATAAAATDPAAFLQLARQCAQRMRQLQASLGQLLVGSPTAAAAAAAGGSSWWDASQQSVMSVAVGRKQIGAGEAQALAQLMADFQGVVGKLGQAAEQLQQLPAAATPSSATAAAAAGELLQRQGQGDSPRPFASPRALSDRGAGAGYSEGDMSPGSRWAVRWRGGGLLRGSWATGPGGRLLRLRPLRAPTCP
jgi:hypothetical protein